MKGFDALRVTLSFITLLATQTNVQDVSLIMDSMIPNTESFATTTPLESIHMKLDAGLESAEHVILLPGWYTVSFDVES